MEQEIFIFDGVSLPVDEKEESALEAVKSKLLKAGVSVRGCVMSIYKKSVDARHRDNIKLVYSISVKSEALSDKERRAFTKMGARAVRAESLEVLIGNEIMPQRPLVVGMGPAGMFCALILAEHGYKPIIIDRGDCINDRVKAMESFYIEKILDCDSNI